MSNTKRMQSGRVRIAATDHTTRIVRVERGHPERDCVLLVRTNKPHVTEKWLCRGYEQHGSEGKFAVTYDVSNYMGERYDD